MFDHKPESGKDIEGGSERKNSDRESGKDVSQNSAAVRQDIDEKVRMYKLKMTIANIFQPGKGIMAMDESPESLKKKFEKHNIAYTAEEARTYREFLATTSVPIEKYISGVILHEETFQQKTQNGKLLSDIMKERGIEVGVKIDAGLSPFCGCVQSGEQISLGLDTVSEKIRMLAEGGASFAKWRSLFVVRENLPTPAAIEANVHVLAQFARICQRSGIVPIIEPELLYEDGNVYTEERYEQAARDIYTRLFYTLNMYEIPYEHLVVKTGFVTGSTADKHVVPEKAALHTIRLFEDVVPGNIGGIVFLSGGHDDETSLNILREFSVQKSRRGSCRNATFSYSRAIQNSIMDVWTDSRLEAEKQLHKNVEKLSEAVRPPV